jgi:uncharacterized SAM-binding protein YcdF (DUF218 family)
MWKRLLVLAVIVVALVLLLRHAASFLVVHAPEHADLIVVLAGGNNDLRYWQGVELVQQGYAPHLVLDVFTKELRFGRYDIDLATEFVGQTAPGLATICPLAENSTYDEARYIEKCLRGTNARSILIVTSKYHTRRSLDILQSRMPQYHFSIYGSADPYSFGESWWQTREWAKTTVGEWQRYLWWQLVDRWRSGLVLH